MATTKTYTITINGITKSISDVNKLKEELRQMESTIDSIDANDINIGIDEQSINEVNDELENIEETANQLGNTLKSTFTIDVDGVATDFDNITQAIGFLDDRAQGLAATLQEMKENGEENTEEFRRLTNQFEEYVNQSAKLEKARQYSDAVRDSLASQSRSLDLAIQGFTALGNAMQIASGIAGLFGQNQEEVEQAINRTVQIMAILQAAQELYNQAVTQGTILNRVWTAAMAGAATVMKAFGVATTSASLAIRGLQAAIAATGIGLLVVGVGELVNLLMRLTASSDEAEKNINTIFDLIDRRLEISKKSLEQQVNLGLINDFERLLTLINQTNDAISRLNSNPNLEASFNYLQSDMTKRQNNGTFNDERQLDHYAKLLLELRNNSDYASMSVEELDRTLNELTQGLNEFDPSNLNFTYLSDRANEDLRNYFNQQKDLINELYDYRVELMQKNYNDETVYNELIYENTRKTLSQELDAVRKHYAELRKEYELDAEIKKRLQREAAQGNTQASDILSSNDRMLTAINEAEQRAIEKTAKDYNYRMQQIQDEANELRISAMRDGYKKELAEINQSYNTRLHEIQNREGDTTDLVAALTEQRNAQIMQLNEKYQEERLQSLRQFADDLAALYVQIAEAEYNTAQTNVNNRFDRRESQLSYSTKQLTLNDLDFGDIDFKKYFDTYDLQVTLDANITEVRDFYSEIYTIAKERLERLKQLNEENLTYDYETSVREENNRFDDSMKEMQDLYERGVLSKEEYDHEVEIAEDRHNVRMLELKRTYNTNYKQLENELHNDLQSLQAERYSNEIKGIEDQIKELNKLRSSQQSDVNTSNGLVNSLGNFSLNLIDRSRFENSFREIDQIIDQEMQSLQDKFDSGQITFKDFTTLKQQLESLKDTNNKSLSDMEMDWMDWSQTIISLAASATQQVTQLFAMAADARYQNEMNRIEKERDLLEDELDMLNEQYEKQQEIYERHTNNIQSIEDELSSARGERRTHLIEQLTAEQAAQEKAYAAEQKIERQRQQNEKKQQALEKQQEAAEKRRNNAQKMIQIAQATANTALAVTNALAVQPWFLGVALAAVAAAMGAAQIGIISSVKYAQGGLIKGKSHAQGGIKVEGTNIEVEGNEYVINKHTTMQNLPLIEYINHKRSKITLDDMETFFNSKEAYVKKNRNGSYFAEGGQITAPTTDIKKQIDNVQQNQAPIYVSVVDIERVQNNLNNVRRMAGVIE